MTARMRKGSDMVETNETQRTGLQLLEAFNIALGIWLIAAPYFFAFTIWGSARIISGFVGSLIIGMAMTRLAMDQPRYWWLSLGNVVFGLFLVIAPFAYGYTGSLAATGNHVIVGLLVAVLAAGGLLGYRR